MLQGVDYLDFWTAACPGGWFHLFAPWLGQMSDTEESSAAADAAGLAQQPAAKMKGLSSWAGSEL